MKKITYIFALVLAMVSCAKNTQVSSPDGALTLSVSLTENGVPQYAVEKNGQTILAPSNLGLLFKEADLTRDLELTACSFDSHDETWETVWGEEQFIRDHYRAMRVQFCSRGNGHSMGVEFRVFNDGFAFRYIFPKDEELTLLDERSSYRFAEEPSVWSIPWRTEYYEALWQKHPLSELKDTVCSPVTLEFPGGQYGFLHEAALKDYPAQNLFPVADTAAFCLATYLTPWRNADGDMEEKAFITTEQTSPWRMLIFTETLPEMVASRIMLNLNEPCAIEDANDWIKPMKFIGIWWGMHLRMWTWRMASPNHGATTENMKKYLDFAADHHIGGVLAEGWNLGWEGYEGVNHDRFSFVTPYADYDMDYLANYAHERGVQIVFHHETSGRADEYELDLDTAYQYMQAHGMYAVKTGYVSPIVRTLDGPQWNKGQSGVRHYRKVLETAAKYHVAIDNHEPVMPTGLQRTLPNLMTQEGIRGQEWNAWSADGGSPCEHVTVLPYTRFMAGPSDYTPGVFHFENPIIPGTRVHSTLMNQLGLFVCFYSPLQMACDLPEHYMEHADAFQFIEDVPCDWKQSILLDGKIGDYVVFAREDRASDNWFVGGITDEEARTVEVDCSFLPEGETYTATLYRDAEDAHWETNPYAYKIEEIKVTRDSHLTIPMAPGGGFAISIMK